MNISSELRKNISHRLQVIIISIVALALALLLIATKSWSESNVIEQLEGSKKLELIVGKSIVLKSSNRIKRVSIAAPEVADFVLLSPFEVYLTGKGAGLTNLTLWHQNFTSVYDIEVIYDISRLKQKLHEILPDEKDLRVISTNDTITLSGTISSTENLSQVLAITRAFAPKDKILNLTQVAGVQQVMLEVRVAEMARTTQKSLGINFSYINGNDFVVSLI
jgi:pilus assembly protein CpaC